MEQTTSLHEPNLTYYLPHHPVIKEASSSTRLRVVFDASSKTSTNNSLNDVLMIGPTIERDIVTILLSFRIPINVFTADIKQMYRQILIAEDERDLQRILWRNDPAEAINIYRLKTMTYGTASAPYHAIRTLVQLANEGKQSFPKGAS
ncbi:uncharacterized protein LOC142317663 [Lycorma delicatula]|uniref:uncharacterized protein LOC142317663 n=1 Tax=Lycorma delicatula TaxID=130591 RepID=UPI003F51591C